MIKMILVPIDGSIDCESGCVVQVVEIDEDSAI